MIWYAIYQTSNGALVSLATVVADPLPAGLSKKQIREMPPNSQWNTTLLDWEPRPAPPPDVDRVDEFLTRVTLTDETSVRNGLAVLLADRRFRDPNETYEIEER